MAISINWATKVITIPQNYLTLISGTLYELDTEQFRMDLKNLEDDAEGMVYPDTHRHNTEVTVAGVTYARTIEIINGYSITFENGLYSVRLVGSNNNFFDVENGILNQNYVQVIPGNAAGLIVKTVGSGVTEQDKIDIADAVRTELTPELGLVDAAVSTRATPADIPSAANIADAVLDEAAADHELAGTVGKVLKDTKAGVDDAQGLILAI